MGRATQWQQCHLSWNTADECLHIEDSRLNGVSGVGVCCNLHFSELLNKILLLLQYHVADDSYITHTHAHTTVLRPFFRDHPGEPVPEENLWTLWCKGRLTGRHTERPAGRHSIRTNQCPLPPSRHFFLQAGCPSCHPTNSVKALKATSAFGLGRRC